MRLRVWSMCFCLERVTRSALSQSSKSTRASVLSSATAFRSAGRTRVRNRRLFRFSSVETERSSIRIPR